MLKSFLGKFEVADSPALPFLYFVLFLTMIFTFSVWSQLSMSGSQNAFIICNGESLSETFRQQYPIFLISCCLQFPTILPKSSFEIHLPKIAQILWYLQHLAYLTDLPISEWDVFPFTIVSRNKHGESFKRGVQSTPYTSFARLFLKQLHFFGALKWWYGTL